MKILGLSARIRRKRKYSSYHGEVGKKTQHFYENENTHWKNNFFLKKVVDIEDEWVHNEHITRKGVKNMAHLCIVLELNTRWQSH